MSAFPLHWFSFSPVPSKLKGTRGTNSESDFICDLMTGVSLCCDELGCYMQSVIITTDVITAEMIKVAEFPTVSKAHQAVF